MTRTELNVDVTVRVMGQSGSLVVSRDEFGCRLVVKEWQRQWIEETSGGVKTGLPPVEVQAGIVLSPAAVAEVVRVLQWQCPSAPSVGTVTRSGAGG